MHRTVLTFGLIAGAILSAMMLLTLPFMDQIGMEKGEIIGYSTMIAAFLMVYFGIRSYRDHALAGSIRFGRAFVVGLLITVVASACYVATWQVIYHRIAPDFPDKYIAYVEQQARESGKTEAEVAAQRQEMTEMMALYRNPLINVAITFLEPLPVGLLFTLVSAGILSRRRSQTSAG